MPLPAANPCDHLERLVHEDPGGRGVASFAPQGRFLDAGHLAAAAGSLARSARHVAIVTGFAVAADSQPAAETDGPPGALFLARTLGELGIETTLVSDCYGLPLLEVGCELFGLERSGLAEMPLARGAAAAWVETFLARHMHLTHLVAVERVGPSHTLASLAAQTRGGPPPREAFEREVPPEHRDVCHNMRGEPIDAITAPAHLLFEAAAARRPLTTIGIGDGGNEIGMGRFAWEVLREALGRGEVSRTICRTATEYAVLAGVSNWGAYALAAATCALRGGGERLRAWPAARQGELIEALVTRAGAVDGRTLRREATVDGLPLDQYLATLARITDWCACGSAPQA